MASDLVPQVFSFQQHHVRTTGTDRDLWFVAKDVCEALDIAWRGKETLLGFHPDWIGVRNLRTPIRQKDGTLALMANEVIVISEAAVYKLAFRSRKPNAEAFTDWVAGEVLPSIRKTGAYRAKQRERYERLGKSEEWIDERQEGIEERKTFTAVLQEHASSPRVYPQATNAIYRPVLGGDAARLKMAMQLHPKANLRDGLSTHDLMRVKFAESMAADKIEKEDLRGDDKCVRAARLAGDAVVTALQIVRETKIG